MIQDPIQWARANKYLLNEVQSGVLAVFASDSKQRLGGLLRDSKGAWSFISADESVIPSEDNTLISQSGGSIDMSEFRSQSFGFGLQQSFEGAKLEKNVKEFTLPPESSGTGISEHVSECNLWLPRAAEVYNLSPNIRDYVLTPVPGFFSDIPNTNGDSVTLSDLTKFSPDHGCLAYKTFRGKPTFTEHDNQDYTKAKGVILDVFLRKIRRFGGGKYYKVVMLLAYDRTKDPELCDDILSKRENAYSVGFYFKGYTCSVCGHQVWQKGQAKPCAHTMPRRPTYRRDDGKLVYRQCHDITGFECSSVKNPAFLTAIGPHVFDPSVL